MLFGIFFVGSLVLLGPAAVDAQTQREPLERLQKSISQVKSISAEFVQKKNLKILTRPIESRGLFYFRFPDSVRWEYRSPLKTVSLVHQGRVHRWIGLSDGGWTEDSTSNLEAVRTTLEKLTTWLGGQFKEDETFLAQIEQGPPIRVVLTPKKQALQQFVQKVEILFSEQNAVVQEVNIVENTEASTQIRFVNVRLNEELSERLFEAVK